MKKVEHQREFIFGERCIINIKMELMQIVTCSVMLMVIFGCVVDARSMKMFQANKEVSKAGNQN